MKKNKYLRSPEKGLSEPDKLQVANPCAAGIDIGSTAHFVCVPEALVKEGEAYIRQFGTFTHQLDEVVKWFKELGVTTVAMESTGVYWIPMFQKIEEAGIDVILVNARELKHVPGRKTDWKDCQWIQKLHTFGLLSGAFRPSDGFCRMRTIMRHRGNLVADLAQRVQLMQKSLQQMNILLHHVLSDLDGETGLRILDAILAGERDPDRLVELRDKRIRRSTIDEMKAALRGDWREDHLFVLKQNLDAYRFLQEELTECDKVLEKTMDQVIVQMGLKCQPVAEQASSDGKVQKKKNKKAGNAPQIDLSRQLQALAGVDLTQTSGISVLSSLIIISELGTDMSAWRSEKAFSSYLGLSPNHEISGGKILRNRTRPVANRTASVLRLAALSVGKTDTVLGHFYRRIRARAGAPKAITATARKIACLVYHLLKYKEPYVEPDLGIYLLQFEKQRVLGLARQARTLGYELVRIE